MGQFVMDSLASNPDAVERLKEAREKLGLNLDGFASLTVSGSGKRNCGLGILYGGLDGKKVAAVAGKGTEVETLRVNDREAFRKTMVRRPLCFAPLEKGVLAFGTDVSRLSKAIGLAEHDVKAGKPPKAVARIGRLMKEPCFTGYVNVAEVIKLHDLDKVSAPVLTKVGEAALSVDEKDGGLVEVVLLLSVREGESVPALVDMVWGGMALLELRLKTDPNLRDVLLSHDVMRDGRWIMARVEFANAEVLRIVEKALRRRLL